MSHKTKNILIEVFVYALLAIFMAFVLLVVNAIWLGNGVAVKMVSSVLFAIGIATSALIGAILFVKS